MSAKVIGSLFIAIVVMGAVIAFNTGPGNTTGGDVGGVLMVGLKDQLADVTEVSVRNSAGTVTLKKQQGDGWGVVERGGYPAEFDKLLDLLTALAGAEFREKKTSKPENHHRLGLLSPGESAAAGTEVDSEDGGTATEVWVKTSAGDHAILIGDSPSGRKGQYVRRPGEDQAWLVSLDIDVSAEAGDWIPDVAFDVDSEQVNRVSLAHADGKTLTVTRQEDEIDFAVLGIPEGKELRYPSIGNQLARALTKVRVQDVRVGAASDDAFATASRADFMLKDSSTVTVRAAREGDEYLLRFEVAGENVATDLVAATKWTFVVTEYTHADFAKTMEDMVKAPPEPDDET
jgi:hypothetical protein